MLWSINCDIAVWYLYFGIIFSPFSNLNLFSFSRGCRKGCAFFVFFLEINTINFRCLDVKNKLTFPLRD